jgi:3-deoxy-manno-octulosonate cytidylyltransferase (CMP-KDO synthetase)
MASTRFPNKPLQKIQGIPMLGHVYRRSKLAKSLDAVFVATCDQEISNYCDSIDAPCIMTSRTHERATDRTAEAVETIERKLGKSVDLVMMIQGDEPMLQPSVLDQCLLVLRKDPDAAIVNLMERISTDEDFHSVNVVKVVISLGGYALYFSREPIPFSRKLTTPVALYKQLGLIGFRRHYLARFQSLQPTSLEIAESCDMMRALEHGDRIRMVLTEHQSIGVDTPADLERVERLMATDELLRAYH